MGCGGGGGGGGDYLPFGGVGVQVDVADVEEVVAWVAAVLEEDKVRVGLSRRGVVGCGLDCEIMDSIPSMGLRRGR